MHISCHHKRIDCFSEYLDLIQPRVVEQKWQVLLIYGAFPLICFAVYS